MGDPNERPVSKYFAKHFDVEEAFLYPVQCGKCKCWFAVDDKWAHVYRPGDIEYEDFVYVSCPYCKHKVHYHV